MSPAGAEAPWWRALTPLAPPTPALAYTDELGSGSFSPSPQPSPSPQLSALTVPSARPGCCSPPSKRRLFAAKAAGPAHGPGIAALTLRPPPGGPPPAWAAWAYLRLLPLSLQPQAAYFGLGWPCAHEPLFEARHEALEAVLYAATYLHRLEQYQAPKATQLPRGRAARPPCPGPHPLLDGPEPAMSPGLLVVAALRLARKMTACHGRHGSAAIWGQLAGWVESVRFGPAGISVVDAYAIEAPAIAAAEGALFAALGHNACVGLGTATDWADGRDPPDGRDCGPPAEPGHGLPALRDCAPVAAALRTCAERELQGELLGWCPGPNACDDTGLAIRALSAALLGQPLC